MCAKTSSEPFPTKTVSTGTCCCFAIACLSSDASGSGYRRKTSAELANTCCTATTSLGDGGYGFSLVFSFKIFWIFGCSPGVYGSNSRTSGLQKRICSVVIFIFKFSKFPLLTSLTFTLKQCLKLIQREEYSFFIIFPLSLVGES